ncbi:MAG: hypothetical protein JSS82_03660 [Bacteroidetes bacterium]|nr:hypothetical protein [Bacteroidota bacterium]
MQNITIASVISLDGRDHILAQVCVPHGTEIEQINALLFYQLVDNGSTYNVQGDFEQDPDVVTCFHHYSI